MSHDHPEEDNTHTTENTPEALALAAAPVKYVNHLTPPTEASFFSMLDHSVKDRYGFKVGPDDKQVLVNWNITFYTYATAASPNDPNFTQQGGQVYIIAVHSGSAKVPKGAYGRLKFGISSFGKPVTAVSHMPKTNSGVKTPEGDWEYAIDFTQTLPMFKNNGQDPLEFQAQYTDTVIHKGIKQDHDVLSSEVNFSLVSASGKIPEGEHAIFGLTVLRHNILEDWPLKPILWVQAWKDAGGWNNDPSAAERFSLPLGFSYGQGK